MRLLACLDEFVRDHYPHSPLTGGMEPAWTSSRSLSAPTFIGLFKSIEALSMTYN
jgi:hypothetical protein